MKRRLFVLFILTAVMLLACSFAAAEDPTVHMQLSTSTFTGPQTVNVTIQVSNGGETEMPGPLTLYDPDGNQIEDFGAPVLGVGGSKVWEGTWNVTQEQLEAGYIIYRVRYFELDENGELVSKTMRFRKPIKYEGAVTSVEVTRHISPTTAGNGQTVTVTYDIVNTGTTDITDVVIEEDKGISSKKGTIAKVAAGKKATYSFTVKMGKKDLTSKATITYKAAGTTHTVLKDAAVISYGEMYLSATLEADRKGGVPGDQVKLTLKLKNSGKADYTGVTVTDPVLGEIVSGETVPAGKTVTFEKLVTMADTVDYQFTITATDGDGKQVETSSSRLTLTAVSASDVVQLEIKAEADREVVYELPGIVRFKVLVTNQSNLDLSDVSVSASGVTLYTFPKILAGETREFTRDVSVSMAGQYQFVASAKNQLGERVRFESNIIRIGFAHPTAVPTEAPIVTPPKPVLEDMPSEERYFASTIQPRRILNAAGIVLGVIAAAGLALLIVSLVRHAQAAAHSAKAVDHLELSGPRDYNQPHTGEYEYGEQPAEETPDESQPE